MIMTITTTAIIPPITPPAIAPALLPPLSLSPAPTDGGDEGVVDTFVLSATAVVVAIPVAFEDDENDSINGTLCVYTHFLNHNM